MSPPIDIDGSEIKRATIDGEDVSEITIDGQQTADFVDIPDSAIHQWILDDVGTGTATDSVGAADGTVNAVSSVNGTFVGGSAGSGDGNDDFIDVGTLSNFGSQTDTDFAVLLTFETSDGDDDMLFAVRNTDGTQRFRVSIGHFQAGVGEIGFDIVDPSNTGPGIYTNSSFADGDKHRLVINKTSNDTSGLQIWIDEVQQSTSSYSFSSNGYSSPNDFDRSVYMFAINSGFTDRSFSGILDNVIVINDSLTQTEIEEDYENQPWS